MSIKVWMLVAFLSVGSAVAMDRDMRRAREESLIAEAERQSRESYKAEEVKRKKEQEDADRNFAARLQQEENGRNAGYDRGPREIMPNYPYRQEEPTAPESEEDVATAPEVDYDIDAARSRQVEYQQPPVSPFEQPQEQPNKKKCGMLSRVCAIFQWIKSLFKK